MQELNSIIIIFVTQFFLTILLFGIFLILQKIKYFQPFYMSHCLIFYIPDKSLVEEIGLDSVIYLKMIKCIIYTFLFSTILTCSVILPFNIISNSLTWENYNKEDNILWSNIICCWLISIFIYLILLKYNLDVSILRIHYIQTHKKDPETHTVYISDIPDNIDILDECKRIYGVNSIGNIIKIRLNSAFVIFKKRISHVISITSLHHRQRLYWITKAAPKSDQIIWENLDIGIWFKIFRSIIGWSIYLIIVIFYIIPISSIQGLSIVLLNNTNNYIYIFLINLLISILIHLTMKILPWIFGLLCKFMGVISSYDVDFRIVYMLFYFQIVTLFLESIITGSILNNLKILLTDPYNLINILINGLTQSSYFFINYIIVAGIGAIGINNLRIFPLIKYIFKKEIISELWYNQCIPLYMIIFLLGLTFSCINPIICPIILIYGILSLIPENYNHVYIYKKKHESGGYLWIYIFNQMMTSLYIFELLMLFEFYSVYPKFIVLLPLPFISLLYHYICIKLFTPLLKSIPLHDAAMLDNIEPELTDTEIDIISNQYTYI